MVSGGMACVKYLLFCFNLLFAFSGITILTVGVIFHIAYSHYSNFVYPSFQIAPLVLIGVGVVIFIVAFFGCCGAVKENQCMIITFSILLVAIFILEVSAGVFGYIRRNEVGTMLEDKLNTTIYEYYKNEEIRKTWDIAQHEGECCGIRGPKDWHLVMKNDTLPHTCCPNTADDGSCTITTPNHYTASCFDKLRDMFSNYATVIGGIAIGISVFQLVGVLFACVLARSIRREYETV